jgi:hypothetical protein
MKLIETSGRTARCLAAQDLAMTFKPAIWYPIALALGAINLLGAGFAAGTAEPSHATVHAALALAFGLWARRLRQDPGGSELQDRLEALEALEFEVSNLRQELGETQERLDFAERLMAQSAATRVGPQR